MSQVSVFRRITLVKALRDGCVPALRHLVGKNTHIQSINGLFLDGLRIEEVTSIFKTECRKNYVQLMVRYIHSKQKTDQASSPSSTELKQGQLPIPVSVLANSYETASLLFSCLTKAQLKSSASSLSSLSSSLTSPLSTSLTPSTPSVSFSSMDLDSSDQVFLDNVCEQREVQELGKCSEELSSIRNLPVSDKYIIQANVSVEPCEFLPLDSSPSPNKTLQPKLQLTTYQQLEIPDKQYILQMFPNVDSQLAHLFVRSSGIFLLTTWLKKFADNPLLQVEKLSYWLRLVQTYVSSSEEKRVMIVGLFDSREHECLDKIRECVSHLNDALRESQLYKQVYDCNRERRSSAEKRQYHFVQMFDISQSFDSSQNLLTRMNECMDLFIMNKYHLDKPFFTSVFKGSSGLNVALKQLSSLSGITATPADLQTICSQNPVHALETLAAYSTALVDASKGDALLKPSFLVDFLLKFDVIYDPVIYDVFEIPENHLKRPPIVSTPLMLHILDKVCADQRMPLLSDGSKWSILDWAERLALIYHIGEGPRQELYYFIPLLATDLFGDMAKFSWDPKEEKEYRESDSIVLYAFLHFPATHHFFYQLLADFLKDGSLKSIHTHKFLINYGCNKAILPLCCADPPHVLGVMVVYHPLQNVIEFKTRQNKQRIPNRKSLLEVVQSKLKSSFERSSYVRDYTFSDALSFHIPSSDYDSKLLSSGLWKLCEIGLRGRSGEAGSDSKEPANVLLKTKELTTTQLKPEGWSDVSRSFKKEIPETLFLKCAKKLSSSEDHWALVGSKLNLLTADDIYFLRLNPNPAGNGNEVMKKWQESSLSYRELVSVLSSSDVHLISLANEIENYFID